MLRRAASASMVEASTPIRSHWSSPRSASRCSTQENTASCTSSGSRERVLLSQEWSDTGSLEPSRRNPQNDRLPAQRRSRPPSLSVPATEPTECIRRQRRPVPRAGVVARALLPGEAVEPGLDRDGLQTIVESVPRRARQVGPAQHQVHLPLAPPPQRHARPRIGTSTANQPNPASSTGC
jgi:hypothetical protein